MRGGTAEADVIQDDRQDGRNLGFYQKLKFFKKECKCDVM